MYIDTIRSGWNYTATFAENFAATTVDVFNVDNDDVERFYDTSVRIFYTSPVLEEDKPTEYEKPAIADKPQETKNSSFTDISKGQYYYEPVMWAVGSKITGDTSATTFSPNSNCTRAQVVTFLYRFINK